MRNLFLPLGFSDSDCLILFARWLLLSGRPAPRHSAWPSATWMKQVSQWLWMSCWSCLRKISGRPATEAYSGLSMPWQSDRYHLLTVAFKYAQQCNVSGGHMLINMSDYHKKYLFFFLFASLCDACGVMWHWRSLVLTALDFFSVCVTGPDLHFASPGAPCHHLRPSGPGRWCQGRGSLCAHPCSWRLGTATAQ